MSSNRVLASVRVLVDDAGQSAPTPLFVGFLCALAMSAIFAFREGVSVAATRDFLLLAVATSTAVLIVFGVLVLWSTRNGHRAANLAAMRPGAIVVRATRVLGLSRAARALRTTMPFLPMGLTFVADDTGIEMWAGSAEHPLRLTRAPWEDVDAIRATRVTRAGRTTGGVTVTILGGGGDARVELPFAVTGAGLGGLFAPSASELERVVGSLSARWESARALR